MSYHLTIPVRIGHLKPKSFSATSLQVAGLCMARYHAEHIQRARGYGNEAADLGTSLHAALEAYVREVYINKSHQPNLQLLVDLYKINYMTTFNTSILDGQMYAEGLEMILNWFERTDLSDREVLSVEVKESFALPTPVGDIPFNYIWDRCDRLSQGVYQVVDYKSIRASVTPAQLRDKLQARAYALACQIRYPDAEKIWVEFDLLRHGPVAQSFTRDDQVTTWKYLKAEAKRITDATVSDLEERLNPECQYCVRLVSCDTVQRNMAGGGIMNITDPIKAIDIRAELEYQRKAQQRLIEHLDGIILAGAEHDEVTEYKSEQNRVFFSSSSRREADPYMVEKIIGPDLWALHGSRSIKMATIDKLLKSNELTETQKAQLTSSLGSKAGNLSVKVEPLKKLDAER